MQSIKPETILVIVVFAVIYLALILRKTAKAQLDLYDLVMLSTVATMPVFFALFPGFSHYVSLLTGVKFPFVVLFGLLLAVLFLFIHRMTTRLHALERDNRLLVQELSLLKHSVQHDQGVVHRQSTTGSESL